MQTTMNTFTVITIFPEMIESYGKLSLLGKAEKKKLIRIEGINPRDFAKNKHNTVDDAPFGGGPGMVMKIGPIYEAVNAAKKKNKGTTRVVLLSVRGKAFTNKTAKRLKKYKHLILISGRYEGVDERVAEHIADESVSLGDFVLAGGELGALAIIEAVSRQIKGVLGTYSSLEEKKGSYPTYTRPSIFSPKKGIEWGVPKTLLSGNHDEIEKWRKRYGKL